MQFVSVSNDSRCPQGDIGGFVTCVWAGEATVTVRATKGGQSADLTLIVPGLNDDTTKGTYPKASASFAGYRVQITRLDPQLGVNGAPPRPYTATLLVTRGAAEQPTGTATRVATAGMAIPARLGERLTLSPGEARVFSVEDLSVLFVAVASDSRCPRGDGTIGVACAWAGEATITVLAVHAGRSGELSLTIPGLMDDTTQGKAAERASAPFDGYRIQLVRLEPQPRVDGSRLGPYSATLLVSKP